MGAHEMSFFFRRHLAPLVEGETGFGVAYKSIFAKNGDDSTCSGGIEEENSYEEMTMKEIFTGKGGYFPGLVPLVHSYLDYISCDCVTKKKLMDYLSVIEKRAKGELLTPAMWQRKFVREHPAYKFDSVVTEEIAYDLMMACKEIGEGTRHEPELLGNFMIDRVTTNGAYDTKLESGRVDSTRLVDLLNRYAARADIGVRRRSSLRSAYGSLGPPNGEFQDFSI